MNKLFAFSVLALGAAVLSGCETTGDPNRGGIFWSETKAQQRLQDRQEHLNDVESDTARVNRRNRRMLRELQ